MTLPRPVYARAAALAAGLLVFAGTNGVYAASPAPTPSASPSTATNCTVDPQLASDPQIKAMMDRCQADLAAINGDKTKLQDSIAMAQGSAQSLQDMLKQTNDAIVASHKNMDEINARIHDLEVQQAATARQVEATRVRLASRRAEYAAFVRRNYKFAPQLWASLFESSGLSDFMSRAAALVQVRAFGNEMLAAIKAEEATLEDQKARQAADHATSVRQQAELVKAQEQLTIDQSREFLILGQLNSSIASAQSELKNASGQSATLVAQIVAAMVAREDQLIQAANDAAWAAAQAWMAANNAVITGDPTSQHSKRFPFVWPAQTGTITQGFGATDYAAEPPGFGAAHFHAGIDVAAPAGTPIYAADDGIVAAVEDSMLNGVLIGYGRHVIIAHKSPTGGSDVWMTLYGHLNAYQVKVGQQVHQGDLIGLMGSTGNSSGPHVHFELRINNVPVDPSPYLPKPGPSDFRG